MRIEVVGGLAASIRVKKANSEKTVDLGGIFHPFGGLMGAPGVMAGGDGLLGRG